jgi:hypothetical protein
MLVLGYIHNEAQRSLTDVPDDFEAARDLCYLPVRQGWTYGTLVQHPPRLNGLGSAGLSVAATAALAAGSEEALAELTKIQRRSMWLSVVSSVSVAALATVAIVGALRGR